MVGGRQVLGGCRHALGLSILLTFLWIFVVLAEFTATHLVQAIVGVMLVMINGSSAVYLAKNRRTNY